MGERRVIMDERETTGESTGDREGEVEGDGEPFAKEENDPIFGGESGGDDNPGVDNGELDNGLGRIWGDVVNMPSPFGKRRGDRR
jgi:hypothetical protein